MKKQFFFKEKLNKFIPYFRILIGIIAISLVVYLSVSYVRDITTPVDASSIVGEVKAAKINTYSNHIKISSNNQTAYYLKEPSLEEIDQAKKLYAEKLERIAEEERRKKEAQRRKKLKKINALKYYLQSMNSPMASHSELIIDSCSKYGDHFCKYFLSIAGIESGFGRVCSNYSAWGAVTMSFSSWEESIPYSADWLASSYYLKGADTFEALSQSGYHGGDQAARNAWVEDLYYFYYQIPL